MSIEVRKDVLPEDCLRDGETVAEYQDRKRADDAGRARIAAVLATVPAHQFATDPHSKAFPTPGSQPWEAPLRHSKEKLIAAEKAAKK
jgi:hypothetical protein